MKVGGCAKPSRVPLSAHDLPPRTQTRLGSHRTVGGTLTRDCGVEMTVILLDVDNVMCDFTSVYLSHLHKVADRLHTVEEITSFDFTQCVSTVGEDAAVWHSISNTWHSVQGIPEYLGTSEVLARLREHSRVIAVTTPRWRCPRWMTERAHWLLDRGFSESDICFVSDKSLVAGDLLVDDGVHNIKAWQAKHPHGRAILRSQPWNAAFDWADRIESLANVL
jgi:5'(3')-deoxyribonucleotidase